jgi:hypothetical protein
MPYSSLTMLVVWCRVRWSRGGGRKNHAGEHRIVWSNAPAPGPGLAGFTGELSNASVTANAMSLAYGSRAATYAVVTQRPGMLIVDGAAQAPSAVANPTGGWSLSLPKGTHRVSIGFSKFRPPHTPR